MMQYENYAREMLRIKDVTATDNEQLKQTIEAVKQAHEAIYRAVAFDIDGTLTANHAVAIDPAMAETIGDLLRRGVHVLLISGRGRTSTREAAEEILALIQLATRYTRRLQCITHNGIYWLRTPSERPQAFLEVEELIAQPFDFVADIKRQVKVDPEIRTWLLSEELAISEEPSDKAYALRITIRDTAAIDLVALRSKLEDIVRSVSDQQLSIVQGAYGYYTSLDITHASKTNALEYYAKRQGISLDSILRIGDQGHEYGNDFELLSHPRGFTVGTTSKEIGRCFPVLG